MVSTDSIYTSICGIAANHKALLYQIMCYTLLDTKYYKGILILKRATRSLLEELNSVAVKKDSEAIVESRAAHVINSAINLLSTIKESFPPEQAYELERRFLNSIKAGDPAKFTRGIRKLRDSKETAKHLKVIEGDLKDDD